MEKKELGGRWKEREEKKFFKEKFKTTNQQKKVSSTDLFLMD